MEDFVIFSGTANHKLATSVAEHLGARLGLCAVDRFPDGELTVRLDEPVRRKEVFIVQPTSPPVNENLMELLAFADACRRAAAAHVTAIIPYFGYARSDKRHGRREPIMASLVADLLQAVRVDHIITLDLHAPQIEGFFHVPVDSLTAVPTMCKALRGSFPDGAIVVSPDAGRVKTATEYAQRLGTSVAVLHKRRESGTETKVTHVVGDVRDRACLIVDDMISTGGTIAESIEALIEAGAHPDIIVAATHGLLIDGARDKMNREAVREVYVTDTILVEENDWPQLKVVSIAPLIADAIGRFMADGSLSDLY
ncbi:MAG TPA: ribose-phosphate pyrophosphokinase [Blastocatellia bacterium]|nr:ribose-phosphate pyrophosphokinase [Blastocatellia bacterium]